VEKGHRGSGARRFLCFAGALVRKPPPQVHKKKYEKDLKLVKKPYWNNELEEQ